MEMDFGGLAKGYAASRALEPLAQWGVSSALINLGGSSIVTSPGGREWLVGVADPACPQRYAAILVAKGGTSVSCSGTYERRHIFDPRTGEAVGGLRSAVAVTKSAVLGEVLSKTLLLEGNTPSPGLEYLRLTASMEGTTTVESNLHHTSILERRGES